MHKVALLQGGWVHVCLHYLLIFFHQYWMVFYEGRRLDILPHGFSHILFPYLLIIEPLVAQIFNM